MEGDINTRASEGIVNGNNAQNAQTTLLVWTCYCLIINITLLPPNVLAKKLKWEETPTIYQNYNLCLLLVIKSYCVHVKSFDDTAVVIEWKSINDDSGVEEIILQTALPTAPTELQKFFEGFKGKDTGEVYLRLRIISKFQHNEYLANCESWLKSNKSLLMRYLLQSEEASNIGFLGCTLQYNNKDHIARQLSKVCGHEIEVRLAVVANQAKHNLDWKKKTRGLIVNKLNKQGKN